VEIEEVVVVTADVGVVLLELLVALVGVVGVVGIVGVVAGVGKHPASAIGMHVLFKGLKCCPLGHLEYTIAATPGLFGAVQE